jgi:hypothetical protein
VAPNGSQESKVKGWSSAQTPFSRRTRKRQCDEGRGPQFNPERQHHFRSLQIADRDGSQHADAMGRDPTERTTPDLFPTTAVQDISAPTKLPSAEATTDTAPPRHILPKDLSNALKHLSDTELNSLHTATLEEMKRRGRTPPGVETDLQTLRHRFEVRPDLKKQPSPTEKRRHVDIAQAPSLTQGKLNAVRAAFKAGVTPSRIARQFGISQSDVRKALAMNEKKRWFVVISESLKLTA